MYISSPHTSNPHTTVNSQNSSQTRPERYTLEELIREGATGKLYRAHDTETDSPVLLKIVSPAMSREPDFRKYIHDRWAEHQNLFDHPNLARIVELGRCGERYFMAVEDPGGTSLSEKLSEGAMEEEEALDILHQISEGLRAVHRKGIFHGHLKPSDIYITRDSAGRRLVKVMFADLGTTAAKTMAPVFGEAYGTPKYMAPEVIKGAAPHPGADIFSLGVIGYELVTGEEPFESSHPMGYLFANCEAPLTPPCSVNPEVSPELSKVICRCLEREPDDRYETVHRVVDDFDRCAQTLKTGHVSQVPAGTDSAFAREYDVGQPDNAGRGPSKTALLNILAMVLALAALLFTLYSNRSQTPPRPTQPDDREVARSDDDDAESAERDERQAEENGSDETDAQEQERQEAIRHNAQEAYESAMENWKERYSLQESYDMAEAEFRSVEDRYPETVYADRARNMRAQIQCEWARFLEKDEDFEGAIEHYEKALDVAPEDSEYVEVANERMPGALAARAEQCMDSGRYEEARSLYRRISDDFPDSDQASLLAEKEPDILLNEGFIAWQQEEDLANAAEIFGRLLDQYPDSGAADEARGELPDLHLKIARELVDSGDLQAALERLQSIQELHPENQLSQEATELKTDVLYRLYSGARANGDEQAARDYFARLTGEHPHSQHTLRAVRELLELQPESEQELIDESAAKTRLEDAQEALENQDYEGAIRELQNLLRRTGDDSTSAGQALRLLPECHYRSGVHELSLGNPEEFEDSLTYVQERFSFTPWASRASKTLDAHDTTPDGMVFIPEGPFRMGSNRDDLQDFLQSFYPEQITENEDELNIILQAEGFISETPPHTTSTDAFYIDKTEVTNEDYKEFIDATDHTPPEAWSGQQYESGKEEVPVTGVSFEDAEAYAEWAGKELPTEAQWEKAARGEDGRQFPWGDEFREDAAHHMRSSDAGPAPVGSYPDGASPYGVLDMTGNVWEWTRSTFQPYPGQDIDDERAPYGSDHLVLRGGDWAQHHIQEIPTRATFRFPVKPDHKSNRLGFRCVKPAE